MTDLGVIRLDAFNPDEVEPIEFSVEYLDGADVRVEHFRARGTIPFAHLIEWSYTPAEFATPALIDFFRRSILPDDWARFFALITDDRYEAKTSLVSLIRRLVEHYQRVDPTKARSTGPKKSANGRPRTGRGSSASRRGKDSTSR